MQSADEPTPAPDAETAGPEAGDGPGEGEVRNIHVPLKDVRPEEIARGIHGFDDLPLHPLLAEAVRKIGWPSPTPVQKLCLPYTLRGRDVAGFAQTGTGKTAVFLMTIVNKLLSAEPAPEGTAPVAAAPSDGPAADPALSGGPDELPEAPASGLARMPRAVVIAPTRELAMQLESDAEVMFAHAGLVSLAVFGGIDYDKQARKLKEGVDVIFATPGRLIDYVKKKWVKLEQVSVFVCDEADRMFDMGFIEDVEFFLERIPETSQKMLFSATTNEQVKELAFEYLETPEYISVNPETLTPEKIEQHALHCHATDKLKVILGLLRDHKPECTIIFTNTKLTAEWLHYKLVNNGIESDLITGDLPQKKRIKLIQTIKEGTLKALIATDVASRGLHISRVTHVYNFDLPDEAANYIHRVGRTARAGAKGYAYSLVCDDYGGNLAAINDLLGPQIALHTEWPDDKYLTIQDQAGNPFEGRYRERAERLAGRAGAEDGRFSSGPRGGSGSAGGDRGGRDRDRDRDRGRDRDRDRGPRQDAGPRHGASGSGQGGPRDQPRQTGRPDQGRHDQPRHDGEGSGKKRRRRRGKGGQGGGPDHLNGPGPQGGGRGFPDRHGGPRPGQPMAAKGPGDLPEAQPKTMGGMIKRIVKALFGLGK